MGNSAKIASICSGIKKSGHDIGTKNIFLFFGNKCNNIEQLCIVEKSFENFEKSVSIDEAYKIIMKLCDNNPHISIYFCGAHPFARYEWIERLYNKKLELKFNVFSSIPDTENLAKILHVIDSIVIMIDRKDCFNDNLDYNFEKFMILSKFRNLHLMICIDNFENLQKPEFLSKISLLTEKISSSVEVVYI